MITEDQLEQLALRWFQDTGWSSANGAEISPEGAAPERSDFRSVVLKTRLAAAVKRLNPKLPDTAVQEVAHVVTTPGETSLPRNNRAFHRLLQGVSDIFKLAGLDRPNIGLLSDEFLEDVRSTPMKNLAVELLERLLNDEIRSSTRTNLVQEKKYSERLLATLAQYHNRAIQTAQVIEELIAMAKDFQEALTLDSMGRGKVMAYDVNVRCGDVLVHPGELVFADFDGVVVIPREVEDAALAGAFEKATKENQSRGDLFKGDTLRAVYDRYGVL